MSRAYGSFLMVIDCLQRIKIRCYNICRSYGTFTFTFKTFHRAIGSKHYVATDFNPLVNMK